jgi:hypothetical protein
MSLTIYPYSIQIVRQDLNIESSAKNEPFVYTKAEVDLTGITMDTLHKLRSECFAIKERLDAEILRRAKAV